MLKVLRKELKSFANNDRRKVSQRYFKTGPGEYGEGDVFLGVAVPDVRRVAKKFKEMESGEVEKLLQSRIHEERQAALAILIHQFEKGNAEKQMEVYELYIRNRGGVNNWDLVDMSAPKIVGAYLWKRSRSPLREMIKSENIWDRRIAIMATLYFIVHGEAKETFLLVKKVFGDKEDLIHKAAGWMLREAGSRVSLRQEKEFLDKYVHVMPRVMLRYAIEKMTPAERQRYLFTTRNE